MFDDHGNLLPGFHDWTIAEAEERLVQAFPRSRTRSRIWVGYRKLCGELLAIIKECEHWLNGSFVTAKPDPGDLDLLVIAGNMELDELPKLRYLRFRELVSGDDTKSRYNCDAYLLKELPRAHEQYEEYRTVRKYWMGEFGFDRDDQPKGIVRVRLATTI